MTDVTITATALLIAFGCGSSADRTAPTTTSPGTKSSTAPPPATAQVAAFPRVDADLAAFGERVAEMRAEFEAILADQHDREWVKSKIAHMVDVDQYMRRWQMNREYSGAQRAYFNEQLTPRWEAIDVGNTADLKALIAIHGWFKISEFGDQTAHQAWLLVQHADRDPAFQEQILKELEPLYTIGEARPSSYAYLYDRVASGKGEPQRFGTQGQCQPGGWQPHELEDADRVDEFRASVGLPPMVEYQERFVDICPGPPTTREKALAAYNEKRFAECGALYRESAGATKGATLRADDLYNGACCFALSGDDERAFAMLSQTVSLGVWTEREYAHMEVDADLASLRDDARWKPLFDGRP